MDRESILRHIQNAKETASVDFKREFYASLKHSDIAKDVAAFANLVNKEDKYIIFGVDDETREIVGMAPETFAKQDDIDSYLEDKIEPFPIGNRSLIQNNSTKTPRESPAASKI